MGTIWNAIKQGIKEGWSEAVDRLNATEQKNGSRLAEIGGTLREIDANTR